jgi:competence protein ComEC
MAVTTEMAPSTGFAALQMALRNGLIAVELRLEAERTQLALWLPVMLGLGIALWFLLPSRTGWIAVLCGGTMLSALGLSIGLTRRLGLALLLAGFMTSLGCGLVWMRALHADEMTITRPVVANFSGVIRRVDQAAALEQVRYLVVPDVDARLPMLVRVSVQRDAVDATLAPGDHVAIRARLMPPAEAAVPGAYDFARAAWFQRLGATGKALDPIKRIGAAPSLALPLRQRLSAFIAERSREDTQGLAAALASGDQGRVSADDQAAMRASGLAHLLSISGLHITAVVGAVMFLTIRLLALRPRWALHWPLPLIGAAAGAAAGVGYTLLSGSEVPTIRSCIAALLVLAGLALGREAMTLRLVATGALIVLLLWPESLIGPSFQLSFAAITALVALHEQPFVQSLLMKREENRAKHFGRMLLSLLLTGLVVELALAPIALFHFHKSGLYGAVANIIAIPLTTFIIMPLEALALLFDAVGAGGPFWWMTDQAIAVLLWIAHAVGRAPGAVALVPSVPLGAYALMLSGGVWLLLWRTKMRLAGLVPLLLGTSWMLLAPAPDLLITGDGRHVALRGNDGTMVILRPRAGDYIRDTLAERSGAAMLDEMEALSEAECSDDSCIVTLRRKDRFWRILAIRSAQKLPLRDLTQACHDADIVVSERFLPKSCHPRWILADKSLLRETGGLAISLSEPDAETVKRSGDEHPWRVR